MRTCTQMHRVQSTGVQGGTQLRKREQTLFLSPQNKLQDTREAVVAPQNGTLEFAHCSRIHITAVLGKGWVKWRFLLE